MGRILSLRSAGSRSRQDSRRPRVALAGAKRPQVALFTGCLVRYVYPGVAVALRRLVEAAGYDLVVPEGQACCGAPYTFFGDREGIRRQAEINIAAFSGLEVEAILCPCPSGVKVMVHDYPALTGPKGEAFAAKVMPTSAFLSGKIEPRLRRRETSTAYHDSCHLRFVEGIHAEPRRLLAASSRFEELQGGHRCCGFAGLFSLYHLDLSVRISDEAMARLGDNPPQVLAAECPGCILQWEAAAAYRGLPLKVRHVLEIAAEGLD